MRGLGGHLIRGIVGLCVPTLAVVVLGIYFLVDKVPDFERAERKRVLGEYRQQVVDFRASADPGTQIVRGKGSDWERAGKMAPGYWGVYLREPYRIEGLGAGNQFPIGSVPLWYDDGKGHVIAWWGERVEESDVSTFLRFSVLLFLLVLVFVTVFGVRVFIRYAKERDDFIAATAHDLTTPLVGMRYAIGARDDDARRLVERMLRLVGNLKDFMRLGGKRPPPAKERFDLVEAYAEAYGLFRDDYRDLFDGSDIAMECTDAKMDVLADRTLTVQILWNLLGNDLKYAAPYGRVRARIVRRGGTVVFELEDEGPGMSRREMERAFDRYYRAGDVLKSGKGGFGIGLCTAREFALAMNGGLSVRSAVPHGCIFSLFLPSAI